MIILEETNSQMVPSALSKRMKEIDKKKNFSCVLSKKEEEEEEEIAASYFMSKMINLN